VSVSRRKRILALVDFRLRDLPGLALLKVLLERRGPYDVTLASTFGGSWFHFHLRRVQPDMVLLPGIWNARDVEFSHRLRELGIAVAVVPTEGNGYTEDGRLAIAGLQKDLRAVDLFFVWNEGIAELVRRHQTIPLDRCVVAGVPRFDLYHPRYRSLVLSRKEFCDRYQIDTDARVVTWATNFGWTIFDGKPALLADAVKRYRALGLDWSIPDRVAGDVRSRDALSEMIRKLACENRRDVFVIKVHPGEEPGWYEDWVVRTGLLNLRIVQNEYIADVLAASDLHLHRSCTTAIEAWLLARPTVELQCAPGEWYSAEAMLAGGDVAYSYDDLRNQVRHYLSGAPVAPGHAAARPAIIEWFAGNVDGRAAERYADAIDAWLTRTPHERKPMPWTWRDVRFQVSSALKRVAGLEPYHSVGAWLRGQPQDPRGKYFTEAEAAQWVDRVRAASGGAALERGVR
jgi:surface carbohydrate biosynthesis protein